MLAGEVVISVAGEDGATQKSSEGMNDGEVVISMAGEDGATQKSSEDGGGGVDYIDWLGVTTVMRFWGVVLIYHLSKDGPYVLANGRLAVHCGLMIAVAAAFILGFAGSRVGAPRFTTFCKILNLTFVVCGYLFFLLELILIH